MVITIADLENFLEIHGHPESVIVHPLDFFELCSFSSARIEHNICWFLGVRWVRDAKPDDVLQWGDKRLVADDSPSQ